LFAFRILKKLGMAQGITVTRSGASLYTHSNDNRMLTGTGGATLAYDPVRSLLQINQGGAKTRLAYGGTELPGEYTVEGTLLRRARPGSYPRQKSVV
jgi:hypothetical protein